MNTTFYEVYDVFLNSTIDSYFIDEEKENFSYNILEGLMMSAIISFRHAKQDITQYDLSFIDENNVRGQFKVELSLDEKILLSEYMCLEWANNKLKRGRIMDLQYTGSDAKVVNAKQVVDTAIAIIKQIKTNIIKKKNDYHSHNGNKLITPEFSSLRGIAKQQYNTTRDSGTNNEL